METGPWVQMLRSPSDPPGHSACQSCRPLPHGEGEFSLFQRGGTVLREVREPPGRGCEYPGTPAPLPFGCHQQLHVAGSGLAPLLSASPSHPSV